MTHLTKEEVTEFLALGECEVVFTKANGDERQMLCTLHPNYLPMVDPDAPAGKSNATEHNVVVWDIEADAWRSFRLDALVSGPDLITPA